MPRLRVGVVERQPADIALPRQPNPFEAVVQRHMRRVSLTAHRAHRSARRPGAAGADHSDFYRGASRAYRAHIGQHVSESHRELGAVMPFIALLAAVRPQVGSRRHESGVAPATPPTLDPLSVLRKAPTPAPRELNATPSRQTPGNAPDSLRRRT
jgi:hypothetical protein